MVGISDFYFKGTIKSKDDLPLDADMGSIYLCEDNNDTWVCTSTVNDWTIISPTISDYTITTKSTDRHIIYPSNCRNCGAVLHNHICEYCGSNNSI